MFSGRSLTGLVKGCVLNFIMPYHSRKPVRSGASSGLSNTIFIDKNSKLYIMLIASSGTELFITGSVSLNDRAI